MRLRARGGLTRFGPSISFPAKAAKGRSRTRESARDGDRSRAVLEVKLEPRTSAGGDTAAIGPRPAEAMDISNGYLSQIEAGTREPSQETLRAAASALGVPVSSLIFFSEQMEAPEGVSDTEARLRFGRKILGLLSRIERASE